ncbi:MAG: hypothetical protein ACLRSW_10815 [Christensenellaceae bacterium]
MTYGLFNAQGRGTLFVAGHARLRGMVIGYTNLSDDINVNVCKTTPHQYDPRAATTRSPSSRQQMSLEECLEFIADDELWRSRPNPSEYAAHFEQRACQGEFREKSQVKEILRKK